MRSLLLCSLIPLLCTCVSAQTALSLSDAIQQGLQNNYQIRIAANELEVARSNDSHALTGKMPTISLGVSPGISYRNNSNPASIVAKSSVFSYSVAPNASLNWTLFNGGQIEMNKERLATLSDLSAGQLQLQVENSIADIINMYYNAVVLKKQISVLQRVLKLSLDRIDYQAVRREFGQGGTFDELQAYDAYLSDSSSLVLQQLNYDNTIGNLLVLIGATNFTETIILTTELELDEQTFVASELDRKMMAANSELRTLRIDQQLADINTRLIEAENKPTVGLTAGASYDYSLATGTQTFVFGDNIPDPRDLPGVGATTLSGQVGVSVNYLLFDGGARDVRAQTSKLRELSSRLNFEAAERRNRAILYSTLASYNNQREIISITRRLIANAERNMEVSEERFKGGTINSFDYRQVQVAYINAEFQLINSMRDLKTTETELLRLTGQIVN